jgi:hypothetical protein
VIELDIRSLVPADVVEGIPPSVMQVLVGDIAEAARAKWIQLSYDKLHSSQQEYTRGISAVQRQGNVAWVELRGTFPNMIEQGFDSYDLRDSLLQANDPSVSVGSDGQRYRAVFFRLGTEKTTARNFQRMTDLYAAELGRRHGEEAGRKAAKALGREARRQLKQLQVGQRIKEGDVHARSGGRDFQATALRKDELNPSGHRVRHGHAVDLFAGATVFEQSVKGGKTQRTYGTFRTISTGQPEGWIHPGYKPGAGANLAGQVDEYIGRVGAEMIAAVQKGLLPRV